MPKIEIYDATDRDGAQAVGFSPSVKDKLRIVQMLDDLGVDYAEGGWPGSNPKDRKFFKKAKKLVLKHVIITAFSMTCRAGMRPEEDSNLQQLLKAGTKVVTIVGKTWLLHVDDVIKVSPQENLRLIYETCKFFCKHGIRVFYDAEHFFEGFEDEPKYALQTLAAAVSGGAERVILCDTNGGTLPWDVARVVKIVRRHIKVPLGIHSHNDSGFAIANTIMAVRAGAKQVQVTINGIGERCGNADLCSVIPVLQLKMGIDCIPKEKLAELTALSRKFANISNMATNPFQPFVGKNAFIHKGGMHGDAMRKNSRSYQHIDPHLVGQESSMVASELAGKGIILSKAKSYGLDLTPNEAKDILAKIKELESQGFQLEGADASIELLMRRSKKGYKPPFVIPDYTALSQRHQVRHFTAKAMVEAMVRGKYYTGSDKGDGPINALDKALRRALKDARLNLSEVKLIDYKVRIVDSKDGTAAKVRVSVEMAINGFSWITVWCDTDVIKASFLAIVDGLEYATLKQK